MDFAAQVCALLRDFERNGVTRRTGFANTGRPMHCRRPSLKTVPFEQPMKIRMPSAGSGDHAVSVSRSAQHVARVKQFGDAESKRLASAREARKAMPVPHSGQEVIVPGMTSSVRLAPSCQLRTAIGWARALLR